MTRLEEFRKTRAKIKFLKEREKLAIIEGLAMMTYNPSIGRVFEGGGIGKFSEIIVERSKRLKEISSHRAFNDFHESTVKAIINKIGLSGMKKSNDSPSYGQAQKPLNVFLKVYVDWARLPTPSKAERIRKYLHVPLDSLLMEEIRTTYPDEYKNDVAKEYKTKPREFRLKEIDKTKYEAWQRCLRKIYKERPVLLDGIWSLKRKSKKVALA